TDSASGTASNNRPADPEGVAEIVVRGAELTFDEMSRLFGPRLFELAPKVWQLVVEPLSGIYGQLEALGDADVKLVPTEMGAIARRLLEPKLQTPEAVQLVDERIAQSGNPGEIGQSVVDGLRVLSTVARSVDPALRDRLLETLPWVLSTVESKYAAIRNAGSRALSALCCVNTMPVMQAIIQSLLPILGDTTRVYRRRGVSEAVHYVVDDLGERVLPYLTFLMVPVLARMSDHDEQTRLVCTHCFAQLLRLVPLEAGVPDPAGLPPELIAQRERERKFLDQLMDS
ncbi:TATA-binding protein-associated factor mot1, partial [Spiromyces aspiralis]